MTCWLCCVRRCVRNRAGKQRSRGCRRGPRARAQIYVAAPLPRAPIQILNRIDGEAADREAARLRTAGG